MSTVKDPLIRLILAIAHMIQDRGHRRRDSQAKKHPESFINPSW